MTVLQGETARYSEYHPLHGEYHSEYTPRSRHQHQDVPRRPLG